MMKPIFAVLLCGCLCLSMAACGKAEADDPTEDTSSTAVGPTAADPQAAIDEIYAAIDIKEIQEADALLMQDTLGFDLGNVVEYFVRYSSGRYGLADTYIVKPTEEGYDEVRETLETIKLDRINATASYDILDSNKIAQNAQLFQYGGYWVMLMLPDNETAMKSIEKHIPSTVVETAP